MCLVGPPVPVAIVALEVKAVLVDLQDGSKVAR